MAPKEYNVGDVLLCLDETSKYVFVKINERYDLYGLVHLKMKPLLEPVDNDFFITTPLLFLEKSYVKVDESTVKILFGDKDGKEKTTPQDSRK